MDLRLLEQIKKLTIIALFSDDDLMDILVLKGGTALDIVHRVSNRLSVDLDFSIATDFEQGNIDVIRGKIEKVLKETFKKEGYEVFDINLVEKPKRITPDLENFWGGYTVDFKVIESTKFNQFAINQDSLRRNALVVGLRHKRKITVEISKYEYCATKQDADLDGFTISAYTPEMIVLEKIRAICQQMPGYGKMVKSTSSSPRARDFYDIFQIVEKFKLDLTTKDNLELLQNIFQAKRVPIELIANIGNYKEFHRQDFPSVQIAVGTKIEEFDFFFDYVIEKCQLILKALGVE
jgi:predicted nucleotidyltransferase component of viral defense system